MIFVDNHEVTDRDFVGLLEDTKALCVGKVSNERIQKMSGVEFEDLTYAMMCEAAKRTVFDGDVVQTGPQTFPDIIAKKLFGAEVKTTTENKWVSTGNSVLETTRVPGVERIYLFFGKFGGNFDVKYRLYEECLFEIGVTHSPRYKINMELAGGQSIFDKMGVPYDSLRQDQNSIQTIKHYYRGLLKEGEELWWIDSSGDATVSPIIRSFGEFSEAEKSKFITEAMILFPEIFGSSTLKFERLASYLVTNYNAVSSNLRDTFTAGGRERLNVNGQSVEVSKILYHLHAHAQSISNVISSIEPSKLAYFWRVEEIENDKLAQWLRRLDQFAAKETPTASDVFRAGLSTA